MASPGQWSHSPSSHSGGNPEPQTALANNVLRLCSEQPSKNSAALSTIESGQVKVDLVLSVALAICSRLSVCQ